MEIIALFRAIRELGMPTEASSRRIGFRSQFEHNDARDERRPERGTDQIFFSSDSRHRQFVCKLNYGSPGTAAGIHFGDRDMRGDQRYGLPGTAAGIHSSWRIANPCFRYGLPGTAAGIHYYFLDGLRQQRYGLPGTAAGIHCSSRISLKSGRITSP